MADSGAGRDLLVRVSHRPHRQQRPRLRIMSMSTEPSPRLLTFTLVFGICFAILYVVCDIAALPMFTYHPATDRLEFGFAPARRDEGPAMYWYGWIATSAIGAFTLGIAAALLPERIGSRIPLALAWIV